MGRAISIRRPAMSATAMPIRCSGRPSRWSATAPPRRRPAEERSMPAERRARTGLVAALILLLAGCAGPGGDGQPADYANEARDFGVPQQVQLRPPPYGQP